MTIIDPWDAKVCLSYLNSKEVRDIYVINTHQHHDHIRGNNGLETVGAKNSIPDDYKVFPLPGHTPEHVVFLLEDQTSHLFCGDTLFQAGVGNCKNGGDPNTLYVSIQWLKSQLSDETVLHVGHDYLKKNLEFLSQFQPQHVQARSLLKTLETKQGYELPPFTWGEDKELNPFLRLSETGLRQGLNRLVKGRDHELLSDKEIFIILRSLRDQF